MPSFNSNSDCKITAFCKKTNVINNTNSQLTYLKYNHAVVRLQSRDSKYFTEDHTVDSINFKLQW